MTSFFERLDAYPVGTVFSAANPGPFSNWVLGTGATAVVSSAHNFGGSGKCLVWTFPSSGPSFCDKSTLNGNQLNFSFEWVVDAIPQTFFSLRDDANLVHGALQIDSSGRLFLGNQSGIANAACRTAALSSIAGHEVRVSGSMTSDATNGLAALDVYDKTAGAALYSSGGVGSMVNIGATRGGAMSTIRFPRPGNTTGPATQTLGAWQADDAAPHIFGAYPLNAPPAAAVSGGNQTGIRPGALVTLDATGSTDSDGTIASYLWEQTSGPTIAIDNPAAVVAHYFAPGSLAGVTVGLRLTVVDDQGASSQVNITHTILASDEFYLDATGVWKPMSIYGL